MYPSSSPSSSYGTMGPSGGGGGLSRYDSAPGSLLTTAVDSVIVSQSTHVGPTRYFSPEGSSSESTYMPNTTKTADPREQKGGSNTGLQRSLRLNEFATAINDLKSRAGCGSSSSLSPSLFRHNSSPAGFLNSLTTAAAIDNGFSVTRGISRLNSQRSSTKQAFLSQISEECENFSDGAIGGVHGPRKAAHSHATASFGMGCWDETSSIMFSSPQTKRAKSNSSDSLNMVESQLQFGMSQTDLEMATIEKLIDIPEDSVPCKIRAKRGCATHPRSIAERERRIRISGKLKKLQDLVPNMDKQTSYADMLDLAVQHIKGLQTQVQKLNEELENCTCGCNQTM